MQPCQLCLQEVGEPHSTAVTEPTARLAEAQAHSLVLDSAQEIDASAAKADALQLVEAPSGLPPTLHPMYLSVSGLTL